MSELSKAIGIGWRAGIAAGSNERLGSLLEDRGVHPLRQYTVLRFIALWGVFTEQVGREPRTMDELADVMSVKRRTAFRGQEAFREVFPEYSTPAVLWAVASEQVEGGSVADTIAQLSGIRLA